MKLAILALSAIFFFLIIYRVASQNNELLAQFPSITVDIKGQGSVLGNYDTTLWTNQTFMQFKGIPYAESPNGNLRYKAPVAKLPWRQIMDATEYGRRCPVITTVATLPAEELKHDLEDCLNLCVYTKNLKASRPVMFYVYGGGYYNGSSSDHPPRHLLEKDIVLVVPHYRIGALGWLSTLTDDMPGNAPVMDLLLALQWVQDHIRDFGGDPTKVTIFGQSAGASMIGALLLSTKTPSSYFKRAIIQSGSILAGWAINKDPRVQAERICQALGCGECKSNEQLHQCFKATNVLKLLEVTTTESFSPIVGDVNGVLPQHPSELIKSFNKAVSVMTGFTKHDGSFILATYYDELKQIIGNMSYVSVRQFAEGIMDMANDTTRLTNNLLTRLLFSADILEGNNHKGALAGYFDLVNAQFMKSPVMAMAAHLVQKRLANTYLYSFDYAGEHTRFGYEFGNEHYPFNGGVHHSNDNIYVFSTHALNEADTQIAKKMVELWTSFAINGAPSVSEAPRILPMEFYNGPYFHIDNNITIGHDVLEELTATIDDPDKKSLDREHIEF